MPRLDQKTLTPAQQTIFIRGIDALVQSKVYKRFYDLHWAPGHRRHGAEGMAGLYRFLAWHRKLLLEFERELVNAQAALNIPAAQLVQIPYWRWADPFPAWLDGYTSPLDPAHPKPDRRKAPVALKPTAGDVGEIMTNWRAQLRYEPAPVNDYVRFTFALEGWGQRAGGGDLPGHNHVHAWVHGIMDLVAESPADPVFWLVHAEVDRLWHIWQQAHPNQAPPFDPGDEVMDPWQPTVYAQLTDITVLGYQYDDATY